MRLARVAAIAGLALAACSPPAPHAPNAHDAAIRDYVKEVTGDDLEVGLLQVTVGDVTTDGRYARIRGSIVNRFDKPVEGIRYRVAIIGPGQPPRLLDLWRHDVDTTLGPGEEKHVSLDVTSMYFGSEGSRFSALAFPIKLGGADFATPADYR